MTFRFCWKNMNAEWTGIRYLFFWFRSIFIIRRLHQKLTPLTPISFGTHQFYEFWSKRYKNRHMIAISNFSPLKLKIYFGQFETIGNQKGRPKVSLLPWAPLSHNRTIIFDRTNYISRFWADNSGIRRLDKAFWSESNWRWTRSEENSDFISNRAKFWENKITLFYVTLYVDDDECILAFWLLLDNISTLLFKK